MPNPTDPVYIAYEAAKRRERWSPSRAATPAHRLRNALMRTQGTSCATCQSHDRLRLAATTGAAWDVAVASRGHAAIIGRIATPRRLAVYAAAAASPRVRAYCPRCISAARIRRQLEALNAAAHGPHSHRTL